MTQPIQPTAPAAVPQVAPQAVVQPTAPVAAPQVVAAPQPVAQVIPQAATAPANPSFDQIYAQQLAAAQAAGQFQPGMNPAEPAPIPQAPAPQPVAQRGLLDGLKSRGLDTSGFQSDEDLLNEFATAFPQLQQLPQLQDVAQRYAALMQQQAVSATPAQPAAQPAAPSLMTKGWDRPDFDPSWMDMVQADEASGQFVPKNQFVNPEVARKVNEYHRWRANAGGKFIDDPAAALMPTFDERAAQIAEQKIQEYFAAQTRMQQAQAFTSQHKADLFVLDQGGNPLRDAMGNEVLTPLGQVAMQHAQVAQALPFEARQQYVANQVQFAKWQMQQAAAAQQPQMPAQPQAPAAPTPQQRRDSFLDRAAAASQGAYQPNQSIAMSTPGTPPGAGMRPQGMVRSEDLFESYAMQMAAQNGLINQTAQPPMATATY